MKNAQVLKEVIVKADEDFAQQRDRREADRAGKHRVGDFPAAGHLAIGDHDAKYRVIDRV